MNIVLLQIPLSPQDLNKLIAEFPQYLFLSFTESTYKKFSKENWDRVEIIYGNRLSVEELELAHQLHWIHTSGSNLNKLCAEEIEQRKNILISTTQEENSFQIGEYAMACVLSFAKNLFYWKEADRSPRLLWDSKCRDTMWTLNGRILLQIGLDQAGTEITRQAREFGMKAWGVQQKKSFHPICHQTFSHRDLHSLLPKADVVSLCLPAGKEHANWFGKDELILMKEDSILLLFGSYKGIHEESLLAVAETGKFRGIAIDASYAAAIPAQSPLWSLPNALITPEVSPRPKKGQKESIHTFHYNLRQYVHGNIKEMKNLVESPELSAD